MILSTDSTANLPVEYYNKMGVKMIPMEINLNGATYQDLSADLPPEKFYQFMREGAVPTTAQINEFRAKEYFEGLLKLGEDVLHIGFSSALSGSTDTLKRVAEELNASHKNKVVVVDSLNAAAGEGLLVMYAHDMMKAGKNIDEIATEITDMRNKSCSFFTVEALKYLVRGGRLSKISGMLGTILKIKPILRVNEEGKLVAFKKVISRGKSINELAQICKEKIGDKKYVLINHAVCPNDANRLAQMLRESLDVEPIVCDLTQVIGCHTGPGLLAVFFISK